MAAEIESEVFIKMRHLDADMDNWDNGRRVKVCNLFRPNLWGTVSRKNTQVPEKWPVELRAIAKAATRLLNYGVTVFMFPIGGHIVRAEFCNLSFGRTLPTNNIYWARRI